MHPNRNTARIVGILFLVVNVTFLAGALLLDSVLSAPDYLISASEHHAQLAFGVLLELVNGVAYLGIAMLMYPILKRYSVSMTLGYVAFRILEYGAQILADLSPLSLLKLSEEFVKAGAPEASTFQTLGTLTMADRDSAFLMVSITFGLGALFFYYVLYRSKLVPRFISIWGLIGGIAVLANAILDMFGYPPGNLGVIMLLNELFLGVWLIVKGFSAPDAVSESVT